MRRKTLWAMMISMLLFCMAVSHAEAQKPPLPSKVIPDGLGYNIHFTDAKPGEMEMLADSGATIIRMDFHWGGTEREKGVYDFSAFDRLTDSLEKHNIRPLYILDYSNRHYDQGLSPYTDEGRAAFAKWAAAAAVHFKDRDILWEMYNEPNISFWKPEPKPDDYIKLALETGKAIREAAPNELYIGPATSEIDLDFLEKCFKAGLLEYWDAVSVHPYRQKAPETVIAEYAKLRWLIDKYAPEGKHIPILSAEWGYSSAWGNYNDDIQGKMLPRQWMVNLACDVPISIWYDWHNDGTDPKEPEHHFGTTNFEYHEGRTPVYDPKPSYMAAKTFTETFRGFKYNKRIACFDSEVYLFLFSKGKEIRLAAWTTSTEQPALRQANIPAEYGTKFTIINHLGQKIAEHKVLEEGWTNSKGCVNVADAPVYLIPENDNPMLTQVADRPSLPMVLYMTEEKFKELDAISELGWADNQMHYHWDKFRLPMPTHFSVNFVVSEHGETFRQNTEIHSTNPIFVHPSLVGDQWSFEIENPTGDAFSGWMVYSEPQGETSFLKVELRDGETQKNMPFSLPSANQKISFELRGEVLDDYGEPASCPLVASGFRQPVFCPLNDFAKYDTTSFSDAWQVLPDGDANVGSEQTLELTDEKLAKVTYKFEDGWKFLRLAPKKAMPIEGEPKSMTLRINADGSGNRIRMRFTDSQGQTFQPDGATMTHEGRQYITFDLSGKDTSHWGGPNDGNISYPIRFDSIIIDGTRKACGPNSVEFASPVLVYD